MSKLLTGPDEYEPGEDLARRIEDASGISWLGWYDADKRRELRARISRANALRSSAA